MTIALESFCGKVVEEILVATNHEGVTRIIDDAISALAKKNTDNESIVRYILGAISTLEKLNAMNKTATQWSNIKAAKIRFRRVKTLLEEGAHV